MESRTLTFWRTIVDNLMSQDTATFRDLMGEKSTSLFFHFKHCSFGKRISIECSKFVHHRRRYGITQGSNPQTESPTHENTP